MEKVQLKERKVNQNQNEQAFTQSILENNGNAHFLTSSGLDLNIKTLQHYDKYMVISMDLGTYFISLQYILMGSVFVALALIFLHAYYGNDEEQTQE